MGGCCKPPLPWASVRQWGETSIRCQQGWRELLERLAARSEPAVPYSFRLGYSLRGHQLGIDLGNVALSMGHSLELHLRSYPWASGKGQLRHSRGR